MAAVSKTESINALLTTTSKNYHKAGLVADNIFNSNPVFHCLHGKEDGIRQEDMGGDQIKVGLAYEGNSNVKSYSGYDELDDTPQDGITSAYFDWAQYSGANVLDGISKFKNSGKSKIVSLWREKTKQTTGQFAELLNKHLLDIANVTLATATTGNGGKNIISIPLMVEIDPTSTGAFGGINQANESWWRPIKEGEFRAYYERMYGQRKVVKEVRA